MVVVEMALDGEMKGAVPGAGGGGGGAGVVRGDYW